MPTQFSRTLQYLYFLRFSVLLWLFPCAFAALDSGKLSLSTITLSRGMFVPEYYSGYLCISFFLIASGFVALITARAVIINGAERFGYAGPTCATRILQRKHTVCFGKKNSTHSPPDWLERLFAAEDCSGEVRAVVIAQSPAFLTFGYLAICGSFEMVPWHRILSGLFVGTLMGGIFWYVVNALYYLAYERPFRNRPGELLQLGRNAARTLLLPRKCFGLEIPGPGVFAIGGKQTLEDIATNLRTGLLGKFLQTFRRSRLHCWKQVGYVYDSGALYEAQLFALLAAMGFLELFWGIYPLTAPRANRWGFLALIVLLGTLIWVVSLVWTGTCGDRGLLRRWQTRLSIAAGFFGLCILGLWLETSPDRFPTLASVLLMVIVLSWFFSGLAFFFDRYRVPVLTAVLVAIVLPRACHLYDFGGFEEHFLSTVPRSAAASNLPTPAKVVLDHLKRAESAGDDRSFVIITATGGGLHASAWTARVLQQIYDRLPSKDRQAFSSHILLMSTVSGGSVGASYYLQVLQESRRETSQLVGDAKWSHTEPPEFGYLEKMIVASQCSSLEAIGWGLVYYDFTRTFVPGMPWLMKPSSGDSDLDRWPLLKDRTWALRKSFERNYYDAYCYNAAGTQEGMRVQDRLTLRGRPDRATLYKEALSGWANVTERFTIEQLKAGEDFPAFTLNTTTAEGGDRFLLANYRLPSYSLGPAEVLPAESFLDVFQSRKANERPDLPLSTAAQLSATFPYVSSAARVPGVYATASAHFVDGGYYDDDGTASAIEFLRYALTPKQPSSGAEDDGDERTLETKLCHSANDKLKVLLIEIRNSEDVAAPGNAILPKVLNPGQQSDPRPWAAGLLQQLGFPLEAFWNAGHESVTGRDRNGLDLMRSALRGRLDFEHVIFDDSTPVDNRWYINGAKDPLSWSLTPRERSEVVNSATNARLERCYAATVEYFEHIESNAAPDPVRCRSSPR